MRNFHTLGMTVHLSHIFCQFLLQFLIIWILYMLSLLVHPQSCRAVTLHFGCAKRPSWWYLVSAALGNEYAISNRKPAAHFTVKTPKVLPFNSATRQSLLKDNNHWECGRLYSCGPSLSCIGNLWIHLTGTYRAQADTRQTRSGTIASQVCDDCHCIYSYNHAFYRWQTSAWIPESCFFLFLYNHLAFLSCHPLPL